MKSEGSIEFEGHRGILTKRMRMDAEGLCTVPVLGEVACGLPILAEENIESGRIRDRRARRKST